MQKYVQQTQYSKIAERQREKVFYQEKSVFEIKRPLKDISS